MIPVAIQHCDMAVSGGSEYVSVVAMLAGRVPRERIRKMANIKACEG